MPVLNINIHPSNGAILPVLIGSPGLPSPDQRQRLAMLDIGAEHSAIDLGLVSELGLQAVDQTNLVTPSEPEGERSQVYEASLCIEAPGMVSEVPKQRFTGAELSGQGFSVLIGRDVLVKACFFWNGPAGTLTLSV